MRLVAVVNAENVRREEDEFTGETVDKTDLIITALEDFKLEVCGMFLHNKLGGVKVLTVESYKIPSFSSVVFRDVFIVTKGMTVLVSFDGTTSTNVIGSHIFSESNDTFTIVNRNGFNL